MLASDTTGFNTIILTEVIEHLSDPISFLTKLAEHLPDGGEILLTTPNRSVFPDDACWQTEAPPVHFWWFSESGLRLVARRAELNIHFHNFSSEKAEFRSNRPLPYLSKSGELMPDARSLVTQQGRDSIKLHLKDNFPESFSFLRAIARVSDRRRWHDDRTYQIAAVFAKDA